jgi:predicted dehydrogenase
MNAQLRFGLIGCGYWGPKIARNISSMRNADLTFICDMDENRIAQVAMDFPLAQVSRDQRICSRRISIAWSSRRLYAHISIWRDRRS